MSLTKQQQAALYALFQRNSDGATSYLAFRRRAHGPSGDVLGNYIGLLWCGMYVGIEQDGSTHT